MARGRTDPSLGAVKSHDDQMIARALRPQPGETTLRNALGVGGLACLRCAEG